MIEINRHERTVVVGEHALQGTLSSRLEQLIDFFHRGGALRNKRQINHGHVDRRHTHRKSVQLALQFRQNETHRGSCTRLRRDHGHRGRTSAAQVFMIDVGEHLVVRVGMDRRHDAVLKTDHVVQRLHQRRKAIGGARSVRDDRHCTGQHVMIDAVDHRRVHRAAGGCRDHNLLGPTREMLGCLLVAGKEPCALQHEINAELTPRQFCRIAFRKHLDAIAIDDNRIAVHRNGSREAAMRRVKARQMSVGLWIAEVVDGNDVDFLIAMTLVDRAQNITADATVAIDADANRHGNTP